MTINSFKRWHIVHKWTSLACTVFLLLLCLTGLPLVFRDELAVLLGDAVAPPEHVTATIPVNLQALVNDAQVRRPQDHVQFLTRDDDGPAWFVWFDMHNLLGIVTVLWALVVGETGVINTLDRPLVSYWQQTEVAGMIAPWAGKPTPNALQPMDAVIKVAEATAPDMVVQFVAFPGTLFASSHHFMVFMRGQTALTSRLLSQVLIDAETAQLTDARLLPWYLTALVLSQPLHIGDYGGMPLKVVWALLDFITMIVLISGLYLWWKKRHAPMEQLLPEGDFTNGVILSAVPSAARK